MPEETLFSCESGVPFKWPKGIRLGATRDVILILPWGIFPEGQELRSVLDAPEDAWIGFDRASDGKSIDSIRVALKDGRSIATQRSCMAIATSDEPGPILFRIIKS